MFRNLLKSGDKNVLLLTLGALMLVLGLIAVPFNIGPREHTVDVPHPVDPVLVVPIDEPEQIGMVKLHSADAGAAIAGCEIEGPPGAEPVLVERTPDAPAIVVDDEELAPNLAFTADDTGEYTLTCGEAATVVHLRSEVQPRPLVLGWSMALSVLLLVAGLAGVLIAARRMRAVVPSDEDDHEPGWLEWDLEDEPDDDSDNGHEDESRSRVNI